ncbi:MAG: replication-associated recombination protein A [Deltaproteobacteria bacterium]|nr:replication-associated recombination protein A [Deltaproteobacteria bacterium]
MDLFSQKMNQSAPLADRLRPQTLSEFFGQHHLIGPSQLIQNLWKSKKLFSCILWGPPGVGKTTLAHLLANHVQGEFIALSAVTANVKELKSIMEEAQNRQKLYGKTTILFIDEIHRFNKAQQDYLLPYVEKGVVTFIGATTENPSFEVISALLSRCKVLTLERLSKQDITKIVTRALSEEKGLGKSKLHISKEAQEALLELANGDARSALNALEISAFICAQEKKAEITSSIIEQAFQKKMLYYDKTAEEHYNLISAFIKSMRGSDPNAALYWMMRMLESGEDPLFIARRMVIFSSEDIGNADPQALCLAIATMQAVNFVGMPEAKIPLAQACTYLATAPKSNTSYKAMLLAQTDAKQYGNLEVPLHLRNAPTQLMKDLNYGKGYQYAHDQPQSTVTHTHFPQPLIGKKYYSPTPKHEK